MKRVRNRRLWIVLIAAISLISASIVYAQDAYASDQENQTSTSQKVSITQVPYGQKMTIQGVVVSKQPEGILVRTANADFFQVTIYDGTVVKEKKSNPFRGAKKYTTASLLQGLEVEIKGVGTNAGSIMATELKFRNDDLVVAQSMDTRVVPIEGQLRETQTRLNETEQNAQRLSGQVQELSEISNAARGGAKAAQETADTALSSATNANHGVEAANRRITSLDEYDVINTTMVYFKHGSSELSPESQDKLKTLADTILNEKGYMVEVTGYASSDGDESYNRRLSQRRADSVIQYLAENFRIPLRRFITSFGYGEKQPVADNTTRAGRAENRRVEVKILVNMGLSPAVIKSVTMPAQTDTN